MNELKVIGKNIAQSRKAHGFTQEDLCGLIELDRSYLSEIENGKINVTIKTLISLGVALDVSLEDLVKGTSPKSVKRLR